MHLYRFFFNFFIGILFLLCTALIIQYVITPRFSFKEPSPFSGPHLYNPYNNIDSARWKLANFHSHSRLFMQISKEQDKANKGLDSIYRNLGFNIVGVSDYQNINYFEERRKWFIPAYEHGFQYFKNHQVVLNAKNVSWIDFFFRQSLNNKQFIINHLRRDSSVLITLVHPLLRNAYSLNDLRYLDNYQFLEISNKNNVFTQCYDTILSAGHPVFLMAGDDRHNQDGEGESLESFNLVNSDLSKDSILDAIRTGCLAGVDLKNNFIKTDTEKKKILEKLTSFCQFKLKNDTIIISLTTPAEEISFIGQGGKIKKTFFNCKNGTYFFNKSDTYIRSEIKYFDGTVLFLNPVFRYNKLALRNNFSSSDMLKTWLWRSTFVFILVARLMFPKYSK